MDSIVCYLWQGVGNLSRREFLPEYVNVLGKMIKRHMTLPHRFICVADSAQGLDPKHVEHFATPEAAKVVGNLPTPEGPRFPSCYRRLWSWSREASVLGDRQLVIDIDLVITKSIDHLFESDKEFVGWRPYRDWGQKLRYGGGIYLLKSGSRPQVWEDFQGAPSQGTARNHGYRGSDQAWISYKLCHGKGEEPEAIYGREAGLYSVRDLDKTMTLPKDACIVQFNGPTKPWQSQVAWVKEAWR